MIHVDDIGMFESTVDAFFHIHEVQENVSGSIMTPCKWAPLAASRYRAHDPDRIDWGIHLTLTCELPRRPWLPHTSLDLSDDGTGPAFATHPWLGETAGKTDAIAAELAAQVKWAADRHIYITHLDTHMLTAWHDDVIRLYFDLGREACLPIMAIDDDPFDFFEGHTAWQLRNAFSRQSELISEQDGHRPSPVSSFIQMPLEDVGDRKEWMRSAIQNMNSGVTHFSFHPAIDSNELRTMAADAEYRIADFELLSDSSFWRMITDEGVTVATYRSLNHQVA